MAKNNLFYPKILLVEGATEKWVIPELIEHNGIKWEQNKQRIVEIEILNSNRDRDISSLNNKQIIDTITTYLKGSKLSALGLMLDNDYRPQDKWQSVKNICEKAIRKYYEDQYPDLEIPQFPEQLEKDGLIIDLENNIKFGVWMMPDNETEGMLETFLAYLISADNNETWLYAQETAIQARKKGASYKEYHVDKAKIHTWLAWQDEPGRQLNQAIKYKILDPQHPKGQSFVNWFKKLYNC
jgi:hypothetical protein